MVPIPVFGKQISEEPSSLADDIKVNTHDVPAISVTKPPPPQPVNLPSVNDVVPLPSPPDSNRSSVDVDLEAGRGVRRPVNDDVITSKPPVRKVTPPSHGDVSPLEPSPVGEEETDLLADAAPLDVLSPSPSVEPGLAPISQAVVNVTEPSASLPPTEEDLLSDTTVRLVGGGSSSGVDSTGLDDAEGAVVSDVPVAVVTKSSETSPKKEQTHDNTKSSSLSSFKRLSAHLASGRRKKDSISSNSVKEAL